MPCMCMSVCHRAVCIFLCICSFMKAVGMCCVHMCVTVLYVHIYGGLCTCTSMYMHKCVKNSVYVCFVHACLLGISICMFTSIWCVVRILVS